MLNRYAMSDSRLKMIERTSPISRIPYVLIRAKIKSVSIYVKSDQAVTVRAPLRTSLAFIDDCVDERSAWIISQRKRLSDKISLPKITEKDKPMIKKALMAKARHYLSDYNGKQPNKIFIRYGVSRWGSCSGLGNISLNGYLYYLPDSLFEYVLWHELTHLLHMNHSPLFWQSLSERVPHPKSYRKALAVYLIPKK